MENKTTVFLLIALLFIHWVPLSVLSAQPQPIQRFTFQATSSKVLPGSSGEKAKGHNCTGDIKPENLIGDFAVVSTLYQNACYAGGKYSHKDFLVEIGNAIPSDAVSDTVSFFAVRVFPPKQRATNFLASRHIGFFRSNESQDVFLLNGGILTKLGHTTATENGFQKAEFMDLSSLGQPRVYVFIPQRTAFSPYHKINKNTEEGRLFEDENYAIDKYLYSVSGKPFDTTLDFNFGPESWRALYGQNRVFFMSPTSNGFNVIWQDRANDQIYLSKVDSTLKTQHQEKLESLTKYLLAAAVSDDDGNSYYILIERGDKSNPPRTRRAVAFKANTAGKSLKRVPLDTSIKGINITDFGDNYTCSMAYSNGKVGVILTRQMHRASDGFHHQGAIALVLDGTTLQILKNTGQTSGHSFGNAMVVDSDGKFLAIDLGDNYPRGVNLHRFDETGRKSKLVYTSKVAHSTKAGPSLRKSYPVYQKISGSGKIYYQWSNDTRTYCEVGGVHGFGDHILVLFVGEPDSAGLSLNNARAVSNHNDARNLGMVILKKDFTANDAVLSQGINEKGGFYTFNGTFSEQENKGIVWLTAYKDKMQHNVSRVKTVAVDNDHILIIHEIWTPNSYSSTQLTLLQVSTSSVIKSVNIGPLLQLGWHDDLIVKDGVVYTVTGNAADGKIEVIAISLK